MIYFDNAATTFKKPDGVYKAVIDVLQNKSGNPSRGSHKVALDASRVIFKVRTKLANFFNLKASKHLIFTKNATEANNLILRGLLTKGDHVIISNLEHNSIYRPLNRLQEEGRISFSIVGVEEGKDSFLDEIRALINPQTKLIAVTHASNVTGNLLPIEEIAQIAKDNNIYFMVDAAQTAGVISLDVQKLGIDFLTFTGHKGLYGPQGVGGFCINSNVTLKPLLEGGTGGDSKAKFNPELLPDKYESGTLNTPAIAGLGAGIEFITEVTLNKIKEHEDRLMRKLISGLGNNEKVKILDTKISNRRVGVLSFIVEGIKSSTIGDILNKDYDIAVRTGLHCAPLAHKSIGTYETGTVRVSLSYFNTYKEVNQLIRALDDIICRRGGSNE